MRADLAAGTVRAGAAVPGRPGRRGAAGGLPGAAARAGPRPGLCGQPAAARPGARGLSLIQSGQLRGCAALRAKVLQCGSRWRSGAHLQSGMTAAGSPARRPAERSRGRAPVCGAAPLSYPVRAGAGGAAAAAGAPVQHLVVAAGGCRARGGHRRRGALRQPGPAAHRRDVHVRGRARAGAARAARRAPCA